MTIGQPNSAPRSGAWRRVLWLGAFLALAAWQSSPALSKAPGDVDGASAEAGGKTAPGAAQTAIQKKDSPKAQANETPAADGKADDSKREKVKDPSEGPIDVESIAREMWSVPVPGQPAYDLPRWRNKARAEKFGSIAREKCVNFHKDTLEKDSDDRDYVLGFCDCFGRQAQDVFERIDLDRMAVEKARIEGKKAAGKKLTQEETEFERSYVDTLAEINEQVEEACGNN